MQTLTDKQERFVFEYLIDQNASAAAVRAGYSPKTKGTQAAELMKLPQVRERIAIELGAMFARLRVTGEELLRLQVAAVRFDPAVLFEAPHVPVPLERLDAEAKSAVTVTYEHRRSGEVVTRVRQTPRHVALAALWRRLDQFQKVQAQVFGAGQGRAGEEAAPVGGSASAVRRAGPPPVLDVERLRAAGVEVGVAGVERAGEAVVAGLDAGVAGLAGWADGVAQAPDLRVAEAGVREAGVEAVGEEVREEVGEAQAEGEGGLAQDAMEAPGGIDWEAIERELDAEQGGDAGAGGVVTGDAGAGEVGAVAETVDAVVVGEVEAGEVEAGEVEAGEVVADAVEVHAVEVVSDAAEADAVKTDAVEVDAAVADALVTGEVAQRAQVTEAVVRDAAQSFETLSETGPDASEARLDAAALEACVAGSAAAGDAGDAADALTDAGAPVVGPRAEMSFAAPPTSAVEQRVKARVQKVAAALLARREAGPVQRAAQGTAQRAAAALKAATVKVAAQVAGAEKPYNFREDPGWMWGGRRKPTPEPEPNPVMLQQMADAQWKRQREEARQAAARRGKIAPGQVSTAGMEPGYNPPWLRDNRRRYALGAGEFHWGIDRDD